MGFATVFASIMFAFIFASMIIFAAVVQKNMSETARLEHERDLRETLNSDSEITIDGTNYLVNGSAPQIDTLYADFAAGSLNNITIESEGSLILSTTPATGEFISEIIDTGVPAPTYTALSWTSVVPALTSLTFQVRSGDSVAALQAASFVGPDGTASDQYTVSGTSINNTHSGDRYFQYKAVLYSSDPGPTPELQAVIVDIYRNVGVVYVNATNSGSVKLTPSATDVYIDGQRINRNMTQRTLRLHDTGGQALWDGGETIEFSIFRTISGSAQVTVANGAAQDSTVVN